MIRVSSKGTFYYKKIFPIFWFGFPALIIFAIAAGLKGSHQQVPYALFIVPFFLVLIGTIVMKHLILDLVDEVYDGGEFLLVKNGETEERVMLSNIMNVGYSQLTNPQRITLRLRQPGVFGNEISFIPKNRAWLLTKNLFVEDLIRRIDDRRRAG